MILRRIVLVILMVMILFSTSSIFAEVDGSRDKMPIPQISQWILRPSEGSEWGLA